MKKYAIICFWIGCRMSIEATAQSDVWTLERCIRHAQETNLSVQQAQMQVKMAQLAERQARSNRLPGIEANINLSEQLGRTVNPITNAYENISLTSNNMNVSAGVLLYAGGQVSQSIRQASLDQQAARATAEQISNNLTLQIAQAYLSILLNEEQLKIANKRVVQSREQLRRTDQLIEVGTLPAIERLNFVAQIARDQQSVVAVQNNLDLAILNLKQLLQLDPDYPLQIERPAAIVPADANPEGYMLRAVFNNALVSQPTVRAADFRIQSAEVGVQIARAAYYPRVQAFAQMGTAYAFSTRLPKNESYFNQVNRNFGQSFGIGLTVPIYQRGQTHISVQQAQLQVLNRQIEANQTRQQLKTDIQTAIANVRAAAKQLEAAQHTFETMQTAFENSQKRFVIGAINSLELTTAQNNRDIAENDLIVSKYDYLFKLKILDFYNGRKITLH